MHPLKVAMMLRDDHHAVRQDAPQCLAVYIRAGDNPNLRVLAYRRQQGPAVYDVQPGALRKLKVKVVLALDVWLDIDAHIIGIAISWVELCPKPLGHLVGADDGRHAQQVAALRPGTVEVLAVVGVSKGTFGEDGDAHSFLRRFRRRLWAEPMSHVFWVNIGFKFVATRIELKRYFAFID